MEEQDGCQHSKDVAEAYHRVGCAELEMLDDIHPKQGGTGKEKSTGGKVPV